MEILLALPPQCPTGVGLRRRPHPAGARLRGLPTPCWKPWICTAPTTSATHSRLGSRTPASQAQVTSATARSSRS